MILPHPDVSRARTKTVTLSEPPVQPMLIGACWRKPHWPQAAWPQAALRRSPSLSIHNQAHTCLDLSHVSCGQQTSSAPGHRMLQLCRRHGAPEHVTSCKKQTINSWWAAHCVANRAPAQSTTPAHLIRTRVYCIVNWRNVTSNQWGKSLRFFGFLARSFCSSRFVSGSPLTRRR